MARSTQPDEIKHWFSDFIAGEVEELAVIASKIGEDAIGASRQPEGHIYKDQTSNLTNSKTFIVSLNGQEFNRSALPRVSNGSESGETGEKAGEQYLAELFENVLDKGVSLIAVAGMDYAGYVEDMGLDVLKTADAIIVREFEKLCKGQI